MADKTHKPELAKLPGGADFDVDNATPEDFEKHAEILRRRSLVGSLTTPSADAPAAGFQAPAVGVPAAPAPDDIRAVKDGQERYFSTVTWDLLSGDRDGWEAAVEKPADTLK